MALVRPWKFPSSTARLALLGLVVVYVALLKWVYIVRVTPMFAYTGLLYLPAGVGGELMSWVFALLPALWLPLDVDRPSRLPLWFQYLVVYVPTTTIPLYNTGPGDRSVWVLVAVVLTALIIVQVITAFRRMDIGTLGVSPNTFRMGLLGFAGVLLVPIITAFGFPTHIPGLAEVYDVRAEYKDAISIAGPAAAYAIFWFALVIAPLLLLEGVLNRKWVLGLFGFLGAAFIFSLSGMKTIALSGFFVVGLWVLYRRGGRRMGVLLTGGVVSLIGVSLAADALLRTAIFTSLFIRRTLMVPGLLTGYYYQFYSTHPQTSLGSSFLHGLADYPYDAPPPTIIGTVYLGSPLMHANVNIWGDAFLNFGLIGIVVFAVVLGLILWVFDGLAARRSAAMTVLMLGIPSLTLTNSALTTTLLTHGLGLAFIVVALMPAAPVREGLATSPRWSGAIASSGVGPSNAIN